MLTIKTLLQTISALNPQFLDFPIQVVSDINQIERGQYEGGLALTTRPVVGVAIGQHGLVFFVDKNDDHKREQIMPGFPPGFTTGDADIDKKIREDTSDSGDEWKKG